MTAVTNIVAIAFILGTLVCWVWAWYYRRDDSIAGLAAASIMFAVGSTFAFVGSLVAFGGLLFL